LLRARSIRESLSTSSERIKAESSHKKGRRKRYIIILLPLENLGYVHINKTGGTTEARVKGGGRGLGRGGAVGAQFFLFFFLSLSLSHQNEQTIARSKDSKIQTQKE
jgi:hypothetical protein